MAGLGTGVNYIPTFVGYQSAIGTNSTTSTLLASATFNASGSGEQNQLPYVIVDCTSDVSGTLYFDFSVDGTNWSTYPTNGFSLSAGGRVFRSALKTSRYFRARFVNDSSAQSYFRLYTYYDVIGALDAALNQSIALDAGGVSTRPTLAQDEIVRGLRGGVTYVGKFGYRDTTVAASGEQTLWADNSNLTIMTSSDTFDIAYNSTNDGAGGGATGATTLLIDYLDANFELQSAIHVLGSSGSDTTSFSGLGINRVVVIASGSSNYNVNDITITDTTGGTTQAFIPATDSVTQQLVYHCPINTVPVMKYLRLTTNKTGGSSPNVEFNLRVYNRLVATEYRVRRYNIDTSSTNEVKEDNDISFSGRDVIYITMDTDTNNTVAQGTFSINLYDTV